MNTYGVPKRVFVKGEGVHLWDVEGNQYLDLLGGIAASVLGHAHPVVVRAITKQMSTLDVTSNFFSTPPQIELAHKLASFVTANDPNVSAKVFFANSGTESNEAAFKISRMTGREKIVAMEGAFHGRSMGSLAITWKPEFKEPFQPLPGDVQFVPFGDVDALAAAVDEKTAAVVIEPIQGESGIIVASDDFLQKAREIATAAGALLWFDEVQSGMGRTGTWLASTPSGVTADIVTMAKGLGNGFPMGACIATGAAGELLVPGSHGTTLGGNPVAAAAALATIGEIEQHGLLERATMLNSHLRVKITESNLFEIAAVRGRGLMLAIQLRAGIAPEVVQAGLEAGFVINAPCKDVIRLLPPLIITAEELESLVVALPDLMKTARQY